MKPLRQQIAEIANTLGNKESVILVLIRMMDDNQASHFIIANNLKLECQCECKNKATTLLNMVFENKINMSPNQCGGSFFTSLINYFTCDELIQMTKILGIHDLIDFKLAGMS